jgi:Predicted transcriptional regulator
MRISSKTSIGIHIMILVALYGDKCKLTGNIISRSTGINSVIIRNLLGDLQETGLIQITRGVGGTQLAIPVENISVYDIFSAVDSESLTEIIAFHSNPYQECPVGSVIQNVLKSPYSRIENAMVEAMKKEKLLDVITTVKENRPDWLEAAKSLY